MPHISQADTELSEVLFEFDAVIEDFSSPVERRHFSYEEHLRKMKRLSGSSAGDSDSEYCTALFWTYSGTRWSRTSSDDSAAGYRVWSRAWANHPKVADLSPAAIAVIMFRKNSQHAELSPSVCFSISVVKGAESFGRHSFSFSDEKLNSPAVFSPVCVSPSTPFPKAKLGDTKELEDFIADLDKTIE
ncbi:regulator of cell cycle RGCC-like, partial [Scleropages formosus]